MNNYLCSGFIGHSTYLGALDICKVNFLLLNLFRLFTQPISWVSPSPHFYYDICLQVISPISGGCAAGCLFRCPLALRNTAPALPRWHVFFYPLPPLLISFFSFPLSSSPKFSSSPASPLPPPCSLFLFCLLFRDKVFCLLNNCLQKHPFLEAHLDIIFPMTFISLVVLSVFAVLCAVEIIFMCSYSQNLRVMTDSCVCKVFLSFLDSRFLKKNPSILLFSQILYPQDSILSPKYKHIDIPAKVNKVKEFIQRSLVHK